MRLFLALTGIIVLAWLQLSLFGHVRPLGVIPNLVLVGVVLASLWLNATSALCVAVVGGLMLDFASGGDFGLRMAFFLVLALAIVAARQVGLQADSPITGIAFAALASVLYDLTVLATIHFPLSLTIGSRILAGAIDAAVIAALIYVARSNIRRPGRQTVQFERRLWR